MLTLSPTTLLGTGRKRNLFAHVVDTLGGRIVRGELRAGDAFPVEADLGQEFGASRSVIREAVKSLAAKGLLESRTRTGIRVLPPSRWNLLDLDVLEWRYSSMPPSDFYRELFEVRLMIEPEAAALAAERASEAEIQAIAAAFAGMAAPTETTDVAVAADLAFHREILHASGNVLLLQMGNLIGVGLLVSYRISQDPFAVFLGHHEDVLKAIQRRKPTVARRAMDRLLSETRDFLETHLVPGQGPDVTKRFDRARIPEEE
ncbi:MAG: FadR/GntR family transcriptional regulator [Alphaproteobacteria bacterium]